MKKLEIQLFLEKATTMRSLNIFLSLLFIINLSVSAQTAESLYNEGVKLKDEKNSGQALLKFKQATELKPGYTDALYEMGWCQNDTKDYKGAMATLREVRKTWPAYYKVQFELGYSFEKNEMYDSAKTAYKKCLEINPSNAGVHKQLGGIEYTLNNCAAAIDYYKKFIELKNGLVDDYLIWYRKGFCENAQKDHTSAIQSLLEAEKLKKDYINIYLELGFANKNLKKNDEAIDYYNKAIAVDPKSHIPYNGIGEVYRDNIKDMDKAMEWYKKALTINSKERKACFGIGYCLNTLKKYSEAIPYLKTAIEQEPTYVAAYSELGYAYYMNLNFTSALDALNKAISLNPNTGNAYYYAALVYIEQKNKTKAQEMANGYKQAGKDASALQKKIDALQ